jgi:hypothetical protein
MTLSRRRPLLPALAAAAAVSGLLAGAANGAPATARIESTSAPGAADCPDAAALAANVNEGLGRPSLFAAAATASAPPARIAVTFERAPRGYAATVRIGGAHGGTRKLSNQGPGCGALANAVGVLLVLVLDSDDDAGGAGTPSSPAPSPPGAAAPTATRAAVTADVGVGGGVAEGLVGGWSPALGLGGTLGYRRLSARLGALWLPAKSNEYGPGRVEVGLAAARLALCVTAHRDRFQVGLELCLQQQVGWMRARGFDYDASNRVADHLWLATGVAIVVNGPLGRALGWEVEAGAVRLLQQEQFLVDNLGTAFRSQPVAFMTTLSFTTRVW